MRCNKHKVTSAFLCCRVRVKLENHSVIKLHMAQAVAQAVAQVVIDSSRLLQVPESEYGHADDTKERNHHHARPNIPYDIRT